MAKQRRQGHIKQSGPSTWIVRVSIGETAHGRRGRLNKTIHGSKADAQRFLNGAIKRKDGGEPVALSKQSLGAWLDEWIRVWCDSISARTRDDYVRLLRRYVPGELRVRRLLELTPTDLQGWVNELSARGLSPRTVRMAHGTVRTALNRAVRLGKLARNSATLVDLPKAEHSERQSLTPEQAAALLSACVANEPWGALFAILVYTGMRPGEALGLKWTDVDGSTLRIRRALVRVAGQPAAESSTKTGRSRSLPLSPAALQVLRSHQIAQARRKLLLGARYDDRALVFANELGGYADLHNIVSRYFRPLLQRHGLPRIRLYDLRHSHATLLLAAGEHPKVVQERLGHSSITLTLDTYSHVIPGMQERAGLRLEALLQEARNRA